MKYRKTKKCECAHFYYGPRFLVTDDPYPIYNNEHYCKAGRFDWTWGNHADEPYPCEKCNGFTLSRPKIRERREEAKETRRRMRECKKYEKYLFNHPEAREQQPDVDAAFFDVFGIL